VNPTVVLVVVTVLFTVHHYLGSKIASAFLLGGVPIALALAFGLPLSSIGLGIGRWPETFLAAAGLSAIALPFVFLDARRGDRRDDATALEWVMYLAGYELLFRGFFLFSMEAAFGAETAIAIVTLAYVFAHLPKDWRECAGTLPMGVFFSAAALTTQAIWAPLLAHVAIALCSRHWTRRVLSLTPAAVSSSGFSLQASDEDIDS
jgi:membrane protease YdiL (CAAX protease family)